MSATTSSDLPNWLALQKAKNVADGIGGDNLLTPPPAAARPAWWDNPVGAERLNDTYAGMPSSSFSPLVDRSYASRPLTQAEADQIESGAHDYSLNLFGNLALAEMPDMGPPGTSGRIAAASVRPPGPYPRPPTPATNALNPASAADMASIRAFHGSPYDFNAFDTSKIGTGEGAQAYGHGLYFAESEKTAQYYKDALSKWTNNVAKHVNDITGISDLSPDHLAAIQQVVMGSGLDVAPAATALKARVPALREIDGGSMMGPKPTLERLITAIRGDQSKGSMYEVSLNADPEHFLDWDKPLSEQSQHVQDALSPERLGLKVSGPFGQKGYYGYVDETGKLVGSARTGAPPDTVFNPQELGMSIYRGAGSWSDPVATAQRLQAAGIPGIKYLDQGSRSSGQGTSNYVIFDPKTIEILRKYGIAGLMAGGTAAATQSSNSDQ